MPINNITVESQIGAGWDAQRLAIQNLPPKEAAAVVARLAELSLVALSNLGIQNVHSSVLNRIQDVGSNVIKQIDQK